MTHTTLQSALVIISASISPFFADEPYGDDVTFYICSMIEDTEKLIKDITELTYGRAICNVTGEKYVDLKGID